MCGGLFGWASCAFFHCVVLYVSVKWRRSSLVCRFKPTFWMVVLRRGGICVESHVPLFMLSLILRYSFHASAGVSVPVVRRCSVLIVPGVGRKVSRRARRSAAWSACSCSMSFRSRHHASYVFFLASGVLGSSLFHIA